MCSASTRWNAACVRSASAGQLLATFFGGREVLENPSKVGFRPTAADRVLADMRLSAHVYLDSTATDAAAELQIPLAQP